MLPNPELGFESTWRVGAACRVRFLGNELALDAGARRLRDGIAWQTLPGEIYEGRWENALEMDSARLTARLFRQGRFLGWGRIMLEGTWRAFDEKQGKAQQLPPKDAYRLHLFWENHFFQEDGILQMGLISTRRGAMDDPWDVTRTTHLPSRTVHDLLVGIRLVGVELSLAFRNLLGERVPLSYLTTSNGQEVDIYQIELEERQVGLGADRAALFPESSQVPADAKVDPTPGALGRLGCLGVDRRGVDLLWVEQPLGDRRVGARQRLGGFRSHST